MEYPKVGLTPETMGAQQAKLGISRGLAVMFQWDTNHPSFDHENPMKGPSGRIKCVNHIKVRFYKLVPLVCKFVYNSHPTVNVSATPS